MMKRQLMMVLFMLMISVVLVACGGDANDAVGEDVSEDVVEEAVEDEATDEASDEGEATDVAAAEEIYQKACATCHGKELSGASGPDLRALDLDQDEVADIAVNGHGTMPAGLVEEDEAQVVAEWILSQ